MHLTIYTEEGVQVFKGSSKEFYGANLGVTVRRELAMQFGNKGYLYQKETYDHVTVAKRWSVIKPSGTLRRLKEDHLPPNIKMLDLLNTN